MSLFSLDGNPVLGGAALRDWRWNPSTKAFIKELLIHSLVNNESTPTGTGSNFGLQELIDNKGQMDGFVAAPNGKLYGAPRSRNEVLVINTVENTAYFDDFGLDFSVFTGARWGYGGVLADNGKIYMCPRDATQMLIINTVNETATLTDFGLADMNEPSKWRGGTMGLDGKIYYSSRDANGILVVDPSNDTAVVETFGRDPSYFAGSNKWLGATVAPDGRIYMTPVQARDILIIDPHEGTATRTDMGVPEFTTAAAGTRFCTGSCLGPDGNIYGVPNEYPGILKIDTEKRTASFSLMGLTLGTETRHDGFGGSAPTPGGLGTMGTEVNKFSGSVLGPDGKIYCPAFGGTGLSNTLIIDVLAGTAKVAALSAFGIGSGRYVGAANGPNGKIYVCPRDHPSVMIIDTGVAAWPEAVHLSKQVNKF